MAPTQDVETFTGACSCKAVKYTMHGRPLVTHACFCTDCQLETGSALALNAWIEAERVTINSATPEDRPKSTPEETGLVPNILSTASGSDQCLWRCGRCLTVLWSNYDSDGPTAPEVFRWVKVGTLDEAGRRACQPDVYLYVKSKPEWIVLPTATSDGKEPHIFHEFYDREKVWEKDSLERYRRVLERLSKQGTTAEPNE